MDNTTLAADTHDRRTVLKRIGGLGALTVGLSMGSAAAPGGRPAIYRAGAARTSLDPTTDHLDAGLYMGGYGGYKERGPATEIHDSITARAIAVSSKADTVAFLMIDTVGLGNILIREIRSQAAAAANIPQENIFIGSTHSHSAPDFQGLWGGVPEDYLDYVIDQAAAAVTQAVEHQEPARLMAGEAEVPAQLTSNRRGYGFTDRTLTVLQFKRKPHRGTKGQPDQSPIATLVNFAMHPTIIGRDNRDLATDFVGPLERAVEAAYGGVAVYFNGAQGDVVPNTQTSGTGKERAAAYGEQVAEVASHALDTAQTLPPALSLRQTTVTFPQDNPAFDFAYIQGWFDDYYDWPVETVERDGQEVEVPKDITTRVTRLTFGRGNASLEALSIPGEATTPLGVDVRATMGGRHQAPLGLTQNALGYIIPAAQWMTGRNGNYEETVSLGRETGPLYRGAVNGLYD